MSLCYCICVSAISKLRGGACGKYRFEMGKTPRWHNHDLSGQVKSNGPPVCVVMVIRGLIMSQEYFRNT